MLKILMQKEWKLLCKTWPKLLFSLALYSILLLSYQIIFSAQNFAIIADETMVYIITLISFIIQSYFIKFESDADYSNNIIGYIYKLEGGLFIFTLSKFLTLTFVALTHAIVLALLLMLNEPIWYALIHSCALLLYMIMCALMLLFANSLMLKNDTGFYALIIIPFIIPYMILTIGVLNAPHYLLFMCGIMLIKIPAVLYLVAVMLTREISVS